jgi:hypothetical protein
MDCIHRGLVVLMDRDGQKTDSHVCRNQACETFAQPAEDEVCGACPLRQAKPVPVQPLKSVIPFDRSFPQPKILPDGSIQYEKTGWEPPGPHPGYERKQDDPWTFVPLWRPCEHRQMANRVKPCGCIDVRMFCMHSGCGQYRRRVTPEVCRGCPFASEPTS